MKRRLLIFTATALALTLRAQDTTPAGAPAVPAAADDNDPAAHQGYAPDRYEDLWTKSPFAVATPDEAMATDTADYTLVGVAQLGNVTYASLIEKQNQAHLLVSSDKPLGGLTLNTVSNRADGVYVTFTRDGQSLTLKLEAATAGGAPQANAAPPNPAFIPLPQAAPGGQNIPMPGSFNPATARPLIRIRRPLIHVPPRFQTSPPGQPNPPPGTP